MEIYEVVATIPGDPTIGVYDSDIRVIFEDGYTIDNKEDETYLIKTVCDFAMSHYGDCGKIKLLNFDGNQVWIR
jgi:hypothetical protein